ncbi:hypothetical protein BHE74_00052235 [Ensete ventricosum]|nr:hypothetical protein BHE74_00052235 [Ensete ventricosum]
MLSLLSMSHLYHSYLYYSHTHLNLFRHPYRPYHRCPSLVVTSPLTISSPLHPPLLPSIVPHPTVTLSPHLMSPAENHHLRLQPTQSHRCRSRHCYCTLLPLPSPTIESCRQRPPFSTSSIAQQDPIQILSATIV